MIPDLTDRALFPPFAALPDDGGPDEPPVVLLAQIKDNMTINKPTLVLADRDGHPFALVFDGVGRDGLDLAKLGLKKGATAVVHNARQTVPVPRDAEHGGADTMTAQAARRPFVRIAPGQAHTVAAVPVGLEQTLAAANALRRATPDDASTCSACHAREADADASTSTSTKLLKCTGCAQARYCNRACQTKGWADGHKTECKAWRALTAIWGDTESQ